MPRQNLLYIKIADQIKEIIGQSAENTFLPSERELSARFDVERMTIRRALNLLAEEGMIISIPGKGSLINPARVSFPVKPTAESNILFVLSAGDGEKMKQAFIANLFYRLEKLCYQEGFNLQYLNIGRDNSVQDVSKIFGEVRGIIFYSKIDRQYIDAAADLQTPMILVSNHVEGVHGIVYDNLNGCYEAVTHLIEQGCRRIAFISGDSGYLNSNQRYEGYARALDVHRDRVEFDEELVISGRWDSESGFECMTQLMDRGVKFDGVMAANDAMALGAMRALSQHKIKVPQNVKIVGFDNIESGVYSIPSLSSVSVDSKVIAWIALDMLKHIMLGDAIFDKIMIPTQLIVRESSLNSHCSHEKEVIG